MSRARLVGHIADVPALVDEVPSQEFGARHLSSAIGSQVEDEAVTVTQSIECCRDIAIGETRVERRYTYVPQRDLPLPFVGVVQRLVGQGSSDLVVFT